MDRHIIRTRIAIRVTQGAHSSCRASGLQPPLLLAALALLTGSLAGCQRSADETPSPAVPRVTDSVVEFPQRQSPDSIVAAPPEVHTSRALTLSGRLVWNEDRTVRVQAPFSGRVLRIRVQLGDHVVRGSALADLSSAEYGSAQADFRKFEAAGNVARRTFERTRDLYARGIVSRSELEQAEAAATSADTDITRSRVVLRTYGDAGSQIDNLLTLRSPIDGIVVERNINPGQELRSDQSGAPPFVLTDPASLWIQLDAREEDLGQLRNGSEFLVQSPAFPEASFKGHIIRVADFVDPNTRTVKILGLVPNAGRSLKGQMYVTASLQVDASVNVTAAASAVLLIGDKHYVFVRQGDRFERREVAVGVEQSGRVTLLHGVERGDSLVTDGALYLESLLEQRPGRA